MVESQIGYCLIWGRSSGASACVDQSLAALKAAPSLLHPAAVAKALGLFGHCQYNSTPIEQNI
jgi:hypothetical protein